MQRCRERGRGSKEIVHAHKVIFQQEQYESTSNMKVKVVSKCVSGVLYRICWHTASKRLVISCSFCST